MNFLEKLEGIGEVSLDRQLKMMTTYRVGGKAKYTVYPKDDLGLTELIKICQDEKVPYKLIGKGSNLLCSDNDFDGVIIRLDHTFINSYYEDDYLIAQAGCSIIALAYETMKKGLSGLEFASGIPGTLGGATYMNAGAYKSSMSDIIESVLVWKNGNLEWMKNEELEFGYRTSIFKSHPEWIIIGVKMKLTKEDPDKIRELIEKRRQRRIDTQPLDYPSCGSIFRNPSDNSFAWQYIDALGYRGKQKGGAMVSNKHPNFIINYDNAKASDIKELIDAINKDMQDKYGFTLKLEVEWFNW